LGLDSIKGGEAETLIHLLHEHFSEYTQSKKRGGIKLEVREQGYAFEEDKEQNNEREKRKNNSDNLGDSSAKK
jgi:hypothetical protein